MNSTSAALLRLSKTLSDVLHSRVFSRSMGGGPRTFPGGLNKWQWKRLHEKRSKEKERKLLDQEKQLYEARIRSQIRAAIAGKSESDKDSRKHKPMSPAEHIKALADRFVKPGAEDLWNEDDGAIKADGDPESFACRNETPALIRSPIDVNNLVTGKRENLNVNGANYVSKRDFSVVSRGRFRRNESSSSSEDETKSRLRDDKVSRLGCALNGDRESVGSIDVSKSSKGKTFTKRKKFKGDESSSEDDSDFDTEEGLRLWHDSGKLGSRASLGKYDMKIKKRVPLKQLEEEIDFPEQVGLLRKELNKKLFEEEDKNCEEESIYGQKRFNECGISPQTVKALSLAGYVQMTRVQEVTISACLEGKDVLVKARTGTGKSAAFLLPAIETVLKANATQRVPPVDVLILCPARELASQLAAEANALLKYHDGIGVQTLVGGTRFKVDQKCLESDPCQIIIATPGRLLDHVEDKSGLSVRLMGLKMLILDEADHLLDLGFRKDIEKIVDCLPRKRQSLMFSATIPREVRRISQLVLKRDHAYIDVVGIGSIDTHTKVKQSCLVAPQELHFATVHPLLKQHITNSPDYKVIVFCPTAMMTSLMYLLLQEMKMNVREIHSRKPQIFRNRISDEFREAKRIILVTSDVSARGMNYSDVTLVIQVGIPSGREEYIHRLGRTGRGGKNGEGILLLAPFEEWFLDDIKDLPLEKLACPDLDPEVKLQLDSSMSKVDGSVKEAAYHAWLGYYNSIREISRDKTALAELATRFSESIGLQKPPSLFRRTALKMGLKDIAGIRIRK